MGKFKTGQVVCTNSVYEKARNDIFFNHFVNMSIQRYRKGDWGDTCETDAKSNDYAVKHGERICAVYIYDKKKMDQFYKQDGFEMSRVENEHLDGLTIWIITEWDRSVTTVLFPEEY